MADNLWLEVRNDQGHPVLVNLNNVETVAYSNKTITIFFNRTDGDLLIDYSEHNVAEAKFELIRTTLETLDVRE